MAAGGVRLGAPGQRLSRNYSIGGVSVGPWRRASGPYARGISPQLGRAARERLPVPIRPAPARHPSGRGGRRALCPRASKRRRHRWGRYRPWGIRRRARPRASWDRVPLTTNTSSHMRDANAGLCDRAETPLCCSLSLSQLRTVMFTKEASIDARSTTTWRSTQPLATLRSEKTHARKPPSESPLSKPRATNPSGNLEVIEGATYGFANQLSHSQNRESGG